MSSSSRKRKQEEEEEPDSLDDEAEEDNDGNDNALVVAKQPTTTTTNTNVGVDDDDNDEDNDDVEMEETTATEIEANASANANAKTKTAPIKLKCLKCSRSARKDCTGSLCIKCCADINCVVHEEQRTKTRWKESVMNGTTDIQMKAKYKKLRSIPKGRFKEIEFKYMNDTVVLFDLRTLLEPSLPSSSMSQSESQSQKESTTSTLSIEQNNNNGLSLQSVFEVTTNSASDIAKYNNDIKIKDEILRKSRKNAYVYDEQRDGVRSNRKNIRNIIDNLYQKKFAALLK